MESTGKYWISIFNVLEGHLHAVVANPKYVRAIKGQKTDDKDAMWIADLFKFDIVPSSYIPCKEIRKLRELFRYRYKLVNERSSEKMRLQNALTVSNIALGSVLSDTFGKSASSIIEYLLSGQDFDLEYCKKLLLKRAKDKADDVVASIIGYEVSNDQALKMRLCREHTDCLSSVIGRLDDAIIELSNPYGELVQLASGVPGITETSARYIIAVARMILTCLYHMFLKKEAFQPSDIHYEELPEQLLQKRKEQYIQQAIKLLEKEGMTVLPSSVA